LNVASFPQYLNPELFSLTLDIFDPDLKAVKGSLLRTGWLKPSDGVLQ